jgi:O-antigen/teichoic acid export membrane protein
MKKIAFASLVGYVVVFLLTPLLTRLYTPKELGLFAVFSTGVILLTPIFSLGNEQGVLNEVKLTKARRYFYKGATSALTGFFLVLIIIIVANNVFNIRTDIPLEVLISIPIATCIAVFGVLAINWRIRSRHDRIAANGIFINLAGRGGAQVVLGYLIGGTKALVLGELIGRFLALIISDKKAVIFRSTGLIQIKKQFGFSMWSKYSTYVTPKLFIENFIIWAPSLIFAMLYSPEFAGLIAIAQRFGSTPATIFNQAVGLVFHRSLVTGQEKYPVHMFIHILLSWLILIMLFIGVSVLLEIFGKKYASILLGNEWAEVSNVMLLMLPLYIVQIAVVLVDKLMLFLDFLLAKLVFNVIYAVVMLLSIYIAFFIGVNEYAALNIMAVSVSLSYALLMCVAVGYAFYQMKFK